MFGKEKKQKTSFFEEIEEFVKRKIKEILLSAAKQHLDDLKQEFTIRLVKKIERKVKRELRKTAIMFSALFLMGLGALFLLYGLILTVLSLLQVPSFFTAPLFGLLLLFLGFILYLLK